MSVQFNAPSLKEVSGSLNVNGNRNISEKDFPSLESVGGDMHLALSGFNALPPTLNLVGGNIYLSLELPDALKDECLAMETAGFVKDQVYLVGGQITNSDDGNVVYEEIMPLKSWT